jgi:hypothetical protein
VRHKGCYYHFRTVEQATGFFRALQEGKSVEASRQRWRPSTVRVACAASPKEAERFAARQFNN